MLDAKLSPEVQLLFQMVEAGPFYGFPDSVSVVRISDHFKEMQEQGDLAIVLAKMICYEQIIENMVESLYKQDKLWRKVNRYEGTPRVEKYYNLLGVMEEFMDFEQDSIFCNRIAEKLLHPELFLKKGKDYKGDIDVISRQWGKAICSEDRIIYIQIINLLNAFMKNRECPTLQMKLFIV